jgi:hypothetical protein
MATYTVTTPLNIDSLTAKTGGDIYNINGGELTIDQDTRYGLNNSTSSTMGSITISATLGGIVNMDGRYVRLIAYTGGSGTVPVYNTVISQGSASSVIVGVWSSITSSPTGSGAAMPATGFIKVKSWNSIPFAIGALTGIAATSSGVDTAGWIDVVGSESSTFNIPRLGKWNITGEWFNIGATTGANTGTYQIPTSGLTTYHAGVYVETAAASDVYEFYPNAGSSTSLVTNFSRDWRAKVCWVSTAGIVRFGSDGTNTAGGYIPPSECNVRIGNVFLHNATVASRTANVLPNATLATRFETLTTSSGVINIDKASVGWYLNMNQPYSVNLSNVVVFDNITLTECATAITWSQVNVGQSAALLNFGLLMSLNFAGGTITDCDFTSASLAASGRYVMALTDISGFTFTRLNSSSFTPARGNATTGCMSLNRVVSCTFNNTIIGSGRVLMSTCTNVFFNNSTYYDNTATNTTGSNGMFAFDLALNCLNITIDGLDFGGLSMTQPFNGLLNIGAAGCTNIKLRNLGTYASPLSLGSARRDDQAWTRATTTATITTTVAHGFAIGDTIFVPVSSNTLAITCVAKTIVSVLTATTFTFACLNAGATSGTICYFGTKCANVFTLAPGAAANNVLIQRVYAPHTRTNLYTADNSSKNILLANVFSDYLNIPIMVGLNMLNRNVSGTPTLAVQSAVYGTHWWNGYTCDVANNTTDCTWTRSGTVVTVTSVGHSLRTTAASSSTVAQNIPVSITVSSDEAALPRGIQNFATAISSSVFTIVGVNAGATSGTMSYRVGNGRVGLVMNESTSDTVNVYTLDAGNPNFTSAGTLFMPNIGDQVTFTTPEYLLGQGSTFPIMELQIGGSTNTRYWTTYAIDKNDGNGFGDFHNLYYDRTGGSGVNGAFTFNVTDATGVEIGDYVWGNGIANKTQVTNIVGNTITVDDPNIGTVSGTIRFNHLPSELALSPDTGIKMKWRITTVTTNTTAINFMYIFAESTDIGRGYQYLLDTFDLTLTGLITGSDVVILAAGTETVLNQVNQNLGSSWIHNYETPTVVDIFVVKSGYVPFYIRNYTLQSSNASLPIAQTIDRNFIN